MRRLPPDYRRNVRAALLMFAWSALTSTALAQEPIDKAGKADAPK